MKMSDNPADRPRYVIKDKYADGTIYYRYNPDQLYVDAKIVQRFVNSSYLFR